MTPALPRIIFVTPFFGREHGGVSGSAERIVGYLRSQFDVTVIVPDRSLPSGSVLHESQIGLSILRFGVYQEAKRSAQFVCDLVIGEARTHEVAAIWAIYLGSLAYSAGVAAQILDRPFVALARGNDIDLEIFGTDAFQIQHVLRAARAVPCVSREMEHKVRSWCPEAKSVYIPNGVDEIAFPPLNATNEISSYTVGLFGEVKAKKGLSSLLEALDLSRHRLKIVGRLDDQSQRLLHGFLTLHPEWQSAITLIPFEKKALDLLDHYRSVEIVCIPSTHEGMPNVLLEAMSCGKIVIASEVGGAIDVVSHGENGFLFPPGDSARLKEIVEEVVLLDTSRRDQIKSAARSRVIEQFGWKREMASYLDLCREVATHIKPS